MTSAVVPKQGNHTRFAQMARFGYVDRAIGGQHQTTSTPPAPGDEGFLLLEDGAFLLLEDGALIRLETSLP